MFCPLFDGPPTAFECASCFRRQPWAVTAGRARRFQCALPPPPCLAAAGDEQASTDCSSNADMWGRLRLNIMEAVRYRAAQNPAAEDFQIAVYGKLLSEYGRQAAWAVVAYYDGDPIYDLGYAYGFAERGIHCNQEIPPNLCQQTGGAVVVSTRVRIGDGGPQGEGRVWEDVLNVAFMRSLHDLQPPTEPLLAFGRAARLHIRYCFDQLKNALVGEELLNLSHLATCAINMFSSNEAAPRALLIVPEDGWYGDQLETGSLLKLRPTTLRLLWDEENEDEIAALIAYLLPPLSLTAG